MTSRFTIILFDIMLGIVFVVANFGGYLRNSVRSAATTQPTLFRTISFVTDLPKQTLGSSNEMLYRWMVVCFFALWIYLVGVLILALVRRRGVLAASGLGGFIVGAASLAILCWAALFTMAIVGFVLRVLITITGFVLRIFSFIGSIISSIAGWIGHFVIWAAPVLLPLVVIAIAAFVWKAFGAKVLGLLVAGCALLYFLAPVASWIIRNIFRPVFAWLWSVAVFLLWWLPVIILWIFHLIFVIAASLTGVCLVFGLIGCIGHMIFDQMKTAWDAGRSQKGVAFGSFSLGVSLALILLVSMGQDQSIALPQTIRIAPRADSVQMPKTTTKSKKSKRPDRRAGKTIVSSEPKPTVPTVPTDPRPNATAVDRAWVHSSMVPESFSLTRTFAATLPGGVEKWAARTFVQTSAPIFDAALLLLALSLSLCGMCRGMVSRGEFEMTTTFYSKDLLCLAFIPVAVVLAVVASSEDNQ